MTSRSAHAVALRFLVARAQLSPVLDLVEKWVKSEKWDEAQDALQAFGKTLGIFISGTYEASFSIRAPWYTILDRSDQARLDSDFLQPLANIANIILPRASGVDHVRPYEGMTVARQFDALREALPWVQEIMRDESDEITHGHFKIIPTHGVHDPKEAIETLDKATALVERKFPKVLYGKVYVRKDIKIEGTYEARPGSGAKVAGSYSAVNDSINLSMYATPDRNSMMTLIHEFGHRYHTRILSGDQREKFIQLSTVGDIQEEHFKLAEREGFADEWIARSRGFRDDENFGDGGPVELTERAGLYFAAFPRDEFKAKVSPLSRRFDDKDDSVVPALKKALARSQFGGNLGMILNEDRYHPLSASPYGETSWQENFAESFLAVCVGKALPAALQKFMDAL